MYNTYFGLTKAPFNVTADPEFLFFSRKHKEAFSHLIYGIKERKGFLEITGEIGTGKTTLCRALLNELDQNTPTAFIFNPNLSESQLLHAIIEDFGLKPTRKNRYAYMKTLYDFLIEKLRENQNVVLIIDEAQNLKPRQLEHVRLLSNLETEKEKLLQIILVGQPELKHKLKLPALRQLRQRIAVRYHIMPLDPNEVEPYIRHRLTVAGSNGNILFTDRALRMIYQYTEGVPRLINIICDKSLLLAYVQETNKITHQLIRRSINELEGLIR